MTRKRNCFTALLMASLMLAMTLAAAGPAQAAVWPDRYLEYGLSGEDVRSLQSALSEQGYDVGGVDGVFGANTEAALMAFQSANGLDVDGIAGNMTFAALFGASEGQTGASSAANITRTLSYGSSGSDVSALQRMLKEYGFYNQQYCGCEFSIRGRDSVEEPHPNPLSKREGLSPAL